MANVSKLLHNTVDEHLLSNLEADQVSLRNARTKIRGRLRDAFETSSVEYFGVRVRPRFFTQGSFAYKTLNHPAFPPGQQKDLDDGCYLPLSFVRGEKPSAAAAYFFAFVETALGELADEEGWTLVKDKPTCVRLVISRDGHVDVPLYAIPDGDFRHLVEARNMEKSATFDAKVNSGTRCLPTRSCSRIAKRTGSSRTHARFSTGSSTPFRFTKNASVTTAAS